MKKLSNTYFLKLFTTFLILFAIAKSITLILFLLLPSRGINLENKYNYIPPYVRVDFSNMVVKASSSSRKRYEQSKFVKITSLVLKGLYGGNFEGFIIIAHTSSQMNTSFIKVGEEYAGYKLINILPDGALFVKNKKEYMLYVKELSLLHQLEKKHIKKVNGQKIIAKEDIKFYANNPSKIWQDISIVEFRDGGKIQGFKVTKIKESSKISQLGLLEDDLIIRMNNQKLRSYKDALRVYRELDTLQNIQIVVLRNNEEKELIYEIN